MDIFWVLVFYFILFFDHGYFLKCKTKFANVCLAMHQ